MQRARNIVLGVGGKLRTERNGHLRVVAGEGRTSKPPHRRQNNHLKRRNVSPWQPGSVPSSTFTAPTPLAPYPNTISNPPTRCAPWAPRLQNNASKSNRKQRSTRPRRAFAYAKGPHQRPRPRLRRPRRPVPRLGEREGKTTLGKRQATINATTSSKIVPHFTWRIAVMASSSLLLSQESSREQTVQLTKL